jgi:hypothetical protein
MRGRARLSCNPHRRMLEFTSFAKRIASETDAFLCTLQGSSRGKGRLPIRQTWQTTLRPRRGSRKSTPAALALAACRRRETRMEGLLRISLLAAVQLPTLWRRIDVSGNRRRHPADTEAEKDQQDGLRAFAAPDRPYEYQNNRPGDGKASAVGPIVSEAKHFIPLFISKDTIDNCSSGGTLMGESRTPT